jgi:LPS O-antigen subunit length determinant protein (WzzB/FepE family)
VLEKDVASRLSADKLVTEAKSRELLDLLRSKTALAASVAKLQLQLEGLSAADLVQSPTLPERHAQPKKPMVAIAASLLSVVLLVVFVGLRQTLRNAKANPISAAKLQRIRRAFSGRG